MWSEIILKNSKNQIFNNYIVEKEKWGEAACIGYALYTHHPDI